jgi:hypothetical protein
LWKLDGCGGGVGEEKLLELLVEVVEGGVPLVDDPGNGG